MPRDREPARLRHRYLAHHGAHRRRRSRHRFSTHESGEETQMTGTSAPTGSMSNDGRGYMTEERRLIRDTARDFTMKEVLPVANRLDPEQGIIPMELRQKMADMGYFGIRVPEEYGGLGLGAFEYCLVAEQLARGWM